MPAQAKPWAMQLREKVRAGAGRDDSLALAASRAEDAAGDNYWSAAALASPNPFSPSSPTYYTILEQLSRFSHDQGLDLSLHITPDYLGVRFDENESPIEHLRKIAMDVLSNGSLRGSSEEDTLTEFLNELTVEQQKSKSLETVDDQTQIDRTRQHSGSSASSFYSGSSDGRATRQNKRMSALLATPKWHGKLGKLWEKRKSMHEVKAGPNDEEDDFGLWDNGEMGQHALSATDLKKERAKSGILPQQALLESANEPSRLQTLADLTVLKKPQLSAAYAEYCEQVRLITNVAIAALVFVDKDQAICRASSSNGKLRLPEIQKRSASLSSFVVLNSVQPFVVPSFGNMDQHWLTDCNGATHLEDSQSLAFFYGHPIRIGNSVVGALALYDNVPRQSGLPVIHSAQVAQIAADIATVLVNEQARLVKDSQRFQQIDRAAQALQRSIRGSNAPQSNAARVKVLSQASSIIQAVLEVDCHCLLRITPSPNSGDDIEIGLITSAGAIAPPVLTTSIVLSAIRSRSGLLYRNPDINGMRYASPSTLESFASGMVVPIRSQSDQDIFIAAAFTKSIERVVTEADIQALKKFEDLTRQVIGYKLEVCAVPFAEPSLTRPVLAANHTRSDSSASSIGNSLFGDRESREFSNSSDEERPNTGKSGRSLRTKSLESRLSVIKAFRRSRGSISSSKETTGPSIGLPYACKSGATADGPWMPHPALIEARNANIAHKAHTGERENQSQAEEYRTNSVVVDRDSSHETHCPSSQLSSPSPSITNSYEHVFDYYCDIGLPDECEGGASKADHAKALGSIACEALDRIIEEEESSDSLQSHPDSDYGGHRFHNSSPDSSSSSLTKTSLMADKDLPKTPLCLGDDLYDYSDEVTHPLAYLSEQRKSSISKRKPKPKAIKSQNVPVISKPVVVYDYL